MRRKRYVQNVFGKCVLMDQGEDHTTQQQTAPESRVAWNKGITAEIIQKKPYHNYSVDYFLQPLVHLSSVQCPVVRVLPTYLSSSSSRAGAARQQRDGQAKSFPLKNRVIPTKADVKAHSKIWDKKQEC